MRTRSTCLLLLFLSTAWRHDAPAAEVESSMDSTAAESPSAVVEDSIKTAPRLELGSFDPVLGLDQPWTGDLDEIGERGYLRALVVYSQTHYFLDGATQRGLSYEALREFEAFLNRKLGRRTLKVKVVILPVERDEILAALEQGLADLAAANLTITERRAERVAFSEPFARGVRELVVTGPGGPPLSSLEDLSGKEIYARRSSSYWESLQRLNESLRSRGLNPAQPVPVEEHLQDEDLLEMVHAGLLPIIVVDSHIVGFWREIFTDLTVHDDLALREEGEIAWALRKNSPQLEELVNDFVRQNQVGTLTTNVLLKRYLQDNSWVRNVHADLDRHRFEETIDLFRKYGEKYQFDHLILAALAYQESHLDQSKRSPAGAIGIMQLLPSTAADPNVAIDDITDLENNIHAGTRYLHFVRDRYFSSPDIDPVNATLLSFASYNAGPAKINRLRREAEEAGLDPNVWFANVERVAARRIGRETVQYVGNIAKYYVAYRLVQKKEDAALLGSRDEK